MQSDTTDSSPRLPSFAQLDHLLDQALALDEPARTEFVATLQPGLRERLQQLLELSGALSMSELADHAAQTVEGLAERAEPHTSTAGRWRLQRELGSGGMGQVFYATREDPGSGETASGYLQHAAVKVLWSHRAKDESMARFFRERRILAALDHPGLARFLDGGFLADGRPWFAMEYIDGVDAIEYVAPLSVRETLAVFQEICAAVAYAHERLVVHRDIKPQNLLVDASGRARLLDFGVASVLDDSSDDLHTRTQGSPLTLAFASPEQVSGGLVTVASDIYQLGLLLYQMLTHRTAFDVGNHSLQAVLQMINEQPPVKPSTHKPQIAPDLDAIVLTALRKDPSQRYRSANMLAQDIQNYLDGKPVQAVPYSRWYVARRFIRRNAVVVTIAAAAIVGLGVATLVSLRMANEATQQAQRSKTTQQILADVFRKADPFAESGAGISLADALRRAQPEIEQRIASDPLLSWEVNSTLGKIYEDLGLVEQEAAAWQAVLQAARLLDDEDKSHTLIGIAGYGSTLARANPARAVTYFTAELPPQPPSQAAAQSWLAAQYAFIGALGRVQEFAEADRQTLQMAAAVSQYKVTSPRTLGRLQQQLAGVARRAGDMDAEIAHWQSGVTHMRHAESPPALAITLSNMAIALGRAKRYPESQTAFLEAIEIYETAGHQDESLAGILRGYAGLLFRMDNQHQAIATTQRVLSLLDPGSQVYARFISQVNLAHYAFVVGDMATTIDTMRAALAAAQDNFKDRSNITQRILPVFTKYLLFAGDTTLAAESLGFAACASNRDVQQVLDSLAPEAEQSVRSEIWSALSQANTSPELFATALRIYANHTLAFFDVQDRWRVHESLASLTVAHALPTDVIAEREHLKTLRTTAQQQLAGVGRAKLAELAGYFANSVSPPRQCGN